MQGIALFILFHIFKTNNRQFIVKALSTAILVFFLFAQSFGQSWKELNDSLEYYYSKGDYTNGIAVGEKAIKAAKEEFGTMHSNYATTLTGLAGLYDETGKYEKAEPLYVESIEVFKKVSGTSHPDYASSLHNLATLYYSMGQYEKAELLFIESLGIRKKILGPTHTDYADCMNNLALLYHVMGQYEKAEPLYIESMGIRKKALGPTHEDYAQSLQNMGSMYQAMGQYEKAESLFVESMRIWKQKSDTSDPNYAANLNNLGSLYRSMGQYEKAESLYIESIEIWKKVLGTTHPNYATSLNNLGFLYQTMGEYEKAEPLYVESTEIRKKVLGVSHPLYAQSLNNLAAIYERMGQYEKAEPLYAESMEIRKKALGPDHPEYAQSLNNLALLYGTMGEHEKAERLILKMDTIELQNLLNIFNILSEKEKGNYLLHNTTILQANNSLVYKYKKMSARVLQNNFNQQLFFKSLILADTRNILQRVRSSRDTAIQRVFGSWESRKKLLAKQYSLSLAKRRTDIKVIEQETENLEKELSRKSADFRKQQEVIRISMKDVQKNLQQVEAAIEFISFRLFSKKQTDSIIYAAYVVNKKDSVPQFIPLFEEKQLQQLFDSTGKSATTSAKIFYRGLEIKDRNTKLGSELYKLIWQPLEPYLKGIKKISYSPAGKLYGIAFHALPVDSTTILIDKYQLQQYTSTRQVALRNTESEAVKPANITLFGDANFSMDSLQLTKQRTNQSNTDVSTSIYTPSTRGADNNSWQNLPGTAEEIKKINSLFNQNKLITKTFTKAAASEENLKALGGNSPQILHIATHGFFLPEPDKKKKESGFDQSNTYTLANDPLLRTGLILAGANYAWSGKTPIDGVEDGIATAYEISQLNLSNTELVVLSACETALGDVKGSEGVFGLQRAFKMAGVKKMIVSLWQVPDKETAELMTSFYSYWMKGKKINDAFAQAQADMRKKYSPFYWAAFVMID